MNHVRLYRNELIHLGYGNPVWEPNPGTLYDCVRIGDVGYFQNDQFMPLFNILPPDDSNRTRRLPFPQPYFPALYLPESYPNIQDRNPLEAGVYALESSLTFSASVGVNRWGFGIITTIARNKRVSLIYHLIVLDRYSTENLLYRLPTRKEQHSFCHPKLVAKIRCTTSYSNSICSNTIANGTISPWRNVNAI